MTDAEESVAETEQDQNYDPRVEAAMALLHPADRAMLTLFYWDELTLQEVGEALGCSPNAAKTRLFRSRERFRALYEKGESK